MRHDDTEIFTGFLTWREKQVAEALARLRTYDEVRAELGIRSVHTVRAHARSIKAKLPTKPLVPAQRQIRDWALSADGRANLLDVMEWRARRAGEAQLATEPEPEPESDEARLRCA